MLGALLGRKIGMTQVYDEAGLLKPVTVLEVGPCTVLQVKTVDTDGYSAVQLGFADKPRRKANQSETGHVKKVDAEPKRFIREVRLQEDPTEIKPGDILTVADFQDIGKVDVIAVTKGKGFDLSDFKEQLEQMANLGGMSSLMDKLPGMGQVPDHVKKQVNDKEMGKLVAIINSMTPQERSFPAVIKGSRKRRIAAGSGTQVQDVNKLLKQFAQMQKMMKKMKGGGMAKMMQAMKGRMPPGMPF